MGATGKGAATNLPSVRISLKRQIDKVHFSTHSTYHPTGLELTGELFLGPRPHLETEAPPPWRL